MATRTSHVNFNSKISDMENNLIIYRNTIQGYSFPENRLRCKEYLLVCQKAMDLMLSITKDIKEYKRLSINNNQNPSTAVLKQRLTDEEKRLNHHMVWLIRIINFDENSSINNDCFHQGVTKFLFEQFYL